MACHFSAGNATAFGNLTSFSSARAGRPSLPSKGSGKQQFLIQSCESRYSYGSQAARLLGPPTRFEASKLKVIFIGDEMEKRPLSTAPTRAYTLKHCDFTANLTLAVYKYMDNNKLREWQNSLQRDDVVAEWKNIKDEMSLHVHCRVSGANLLQELAREFRYHVFSKELPLVLQAVVHGDSALFAEKPELMEAKVWVYFHSKSKEHNRVECWGPLKENIQQRNFEDRSDGVHEKIWDGIMKWAGPKAVFHAIISILL